jgi:hypothetical protein
MQDGNTVTQRPVEKTRLLCPKCGNHLFDIWWLGSTAQRQICADCAFEIEIPVDLMGNFVREVFAICEAAEC